MVSKFNNLQTLTLSLRAGLFRCFQTPPKPNIDHRILNVRTWPFCMHTHTRGTLVCGLIPGTFLNTAQNWTGELSERTQSLARNDRHPSAFKGEWSRPELRNCVKIEWSRPELRNCVKVEVAVLGSASLIVLVVSMDVKQHWTVVSQSSGAVWKSRWPSWTPCAY